MVYHFIPYEGCIEVSGQNGFNQNAPLACNNPPTFLVKMCQAFLVKTSPPQSLSTCGQIGMHIQSKLRTPTCKIEKGQAIQQVQYKNQDCSMTVISSVFFLVRAKVITKHYSVITTLMTSMCFLLICLEVTSSRQHQDLSSRVKRHDSTAQY